MNKKDKKSEHNTAAPAIDYHREIAESDRIASNENQQVMQSQIQEILFELKKITEASAEMAMEFKEVTIEQRIENPGEYHVNFFQWMLSVVRAARAKIEDSGAWLNTMKSKKGQRNYWSMFKKHGTTFDFQMSASWLLRQINPLNRPWKINWLSWLFVNHN